MHRAVLGSGNVTRCGVLFPSCPRSPTPRRRSPPSRLGDIDRAGQAGRARADARLSSGIGTRHTALPLERYRDLGDFRQANDTFIEVATDLAERALLRTALADVYLEAPDVDFVMFTSVTGISAPSVGRPARVAPGPAS